MCAGKPSRLWLYAQNRSFSPEFSPAGSGAKRCVRRNLSNAVEGEVCLPFSSFDG